MTAAGRREPTMAYKIHERGRNGSVEVLEDRIVRTLRRRLGREDTQTIAFRAITAVHHDRRVGRDRVRIETSRASYEWKVTDGAGLVEELNAKMYPG